MKAILALADGTVFHGESFGSTKTLGGEVCFNTSMTGYQEVLTDPSYRGQIVTMTYTQIGNYGINSLDVESDRVQVAGFVAREVSPVVSNWRSEMSLHEYLEKNNVPGIQKIDTRALTKLLRSKGATNGIITTEAISDAAAVDLARKVDYNGVDYVSEVTCKEPYVWDPEDRLSGEWTIPNASTGNADAVATGPNWHRRLPPAKYNLVAYDFGIKRNILRRLRQVGFKTTVVPAKTPASEVLKLNADAVFLSNGPGNPELLTYAHSTVRELIGKKTLFGICLGHQIMSYAVGGRTYKLKFGHRGGNQPVMDQTTGRVSITSQNHGFAVDADSVTQSGMEVTHVNLNDNTCEGMRHREHPVFSVQYHPEASPGPNDASYFFRQFADMVGKG
ncbi:MAG: glutamine-hydrolyzing carbamoyl-phosphate synthase small subunit [Verrucomicrobiae bacterium]|nr:glutamine-hydrolyzing carbamoyl-phosphate synthase small subunit [Verrucomicrobiae bacterium]